MDIGFDVISDLFLGPDDNFSWENKATSLYCIVAGNVSSDLKVLDKTLKHLTECYQGVFYIMGSLEYSDAKNIDERTLEILELCSAIPRVAVLFHHVVIIDGIAILGTNGWSIKKDDQLELYDPATKKARIDDIAYLYKSISKLQKHGDVKHILVVSNAVPNKTLYFGEHPKFFDAYSPLSYCLEADTEGKVTKWVFGTYDKSVDTIVDSVHYVNNPYLNRSPFWPKRLTMRI